MNKDCRSQRFSARLVAIRYKWTALSDEIYEAISDVGNFHDAVSILRLTRNFAALAVSGVILSVAAHRLPLDNAFQ